MPEPANQNNIGCLYLVPNTLGEENRLSQLPRVIPAETLKQITRLKNWIVEDAKTARALLNAINQIEEFKKITPITGIIMTKLDGTAKGGILVAIAKQFKIPIYAIGIGEKEEDLDNFIAKDFVQAFIKN